MDDGDVIFLLDDKNEIKKVSRQHYKDEDLFQTLLQEHPELLHGVQLGPNEPVRWLLVSREVGIPDSEGATDRWSLDHLLLDQRAWPTFVEVKRRSDTRIRREVVGQMFDYVAHAKIHWIPGRMRAMAAETCGGEEIADNKVRDFLGIDPGDDIAAKINDFWQRAETNLHAGKLRLLFVADEIPHELRCIIEFLNEEMEDIEVLGIELRQYLHGDIRALVPTVVGQTEAGKIKRSGATAPQGKTTRDGFLGKCDQDARALFDDVLSTAERLAMETYWGAKGFSLRAVMPGGNKASMLYGFPPGANNRALPYLQFYFKDVPAELVHQARAVLVSIPGVKVSGQYTLDITLNPEGIAAVRQGVKTLWPLVEQVRQAVPVLE